MLTAGDGLLANGGPRGWYGIRELDCPPVSDSLKWRATHRVARRRKVHASDEFYRVDVNSCLSTRGLTLA